MGMVLLVCNAVLAAGKLVLGWASGSAAVIADGMNNLMDSVGAIAMIVGFRLAGKKRDPRHPFGRGRMEYVGGFIVSMLIILAALQVGQFAVERIVNSVEVETSMLLVGVLIGSIVVKSGVAIYLLKGNRKLKSKAVEAGMKDCIADNCATMLVLVSMAVAPLTELPVDGIAALGVSVFILLCGVKIFREHTNLLLGGPVDKELRRKIRRIVAAHGIFERVVGLDIHDYGPESREAIIMVDLKSGANQKDVEGEVRRVKLELRKELNVGAIIYWSAGDEIRH